jgi:uncharacterized protein YdeI (YjbR/CyaY-like superfamily)
VWLVLAKAGTTDPTRLRYAEAVDEALCFGWIDGMVRRVDADSYAQRFTPRKAQSNWSQINIKRAHELIAAGRMRPQGLAAFERRAADGPPAYSFEQRSAALSPEQRRRLKANDAAWAFFESQPAYYRRLATWWVTSAKRQETRDRRLATLIEDSAKGRRLTVATPSAVERRSASTTNATKGTKKITPTSGSRS